MSNGSQLSNSPIWNWRSWMNGLPNPYDIFMGPQNLQQPILPGWVLGNVFNVTTQNSSASETEAEIVAAHSYGRQIGRIMDALALVIEELPKKKQAAKAIEKFNEIHGKIDEIKAGAMARRLETLACDLATLKEKKPDEYHRVAAKLREVLKAPTRAT